MKPLGTEISETETLILVACRTLNHWLSFHGEAEHELFISYKLVLNSRFSFGVHFILKCDLK